MPSLASSKFTVLKIIIIDAEVMIGDKGFPQWNSSNKDKKLYCAVKKFMLNYAES